jgi:hypoxanthine phosphoribosyltransferase
LHKAESAEVEVDIDYTGFSIADEWVVGYGLDYAEQNRTLPYIGVIKPDN